jgi:hypothetical protein
MGVRRTALPEGALLKRYRDSGAYTDCYVLDVDGAVSQTDYVCAFYTSWLFKVERFILTWAVAKPSTDAEAEALSAGHREAFAAWTVEGRTSEQLLMCDYQRRTRSWLKTEPLDGGARTRLYFGSAVVPLRPDGRRDRGFGFAFRLLVGFHNLYSRGLLKAARAKLGCQIASNPAA